MKFLAFILLIIVAIPNSCAGQLTEGPEHTIPLECRILNDSAVIVFNQWIESKDQSHFSLSMKLIKEATECDSLYLKAINNQFVFFFEAEKYNECIEPLMKELKLLKGTEPYPLMYLSICYRHLGRLEEMKEYKRKAIRLAKKNYSKYDSFQNFWKLIDTYIKLDEKTQAKTVFERYKKKYPANENDINFLNEFIDQEMKK